MRLILLTAFCCHCLTAVCQPNSSSAVSVWTHRYDNTRLGWNNREKLLNTETVTAKTFGLRHFLLVDDQIYTQPLVLPNLNVGGSVRNVVFVTTVNNSVYAFDADRYGDPLWQVSLTPVGGRPPRNTDMTGACDGKYQDFSGSMGIVGTPVIDTTSATLYVVSRALVGGKYEQYLNALDIITGQHRANSPALIAATIVGNGEGSSGGKLSFEAQKHNQRPALLLHLGVVYVAWASHCDWGPYHGWVIGFDGKTLQNKYVYNVTPTGKEGGIWMSGGGPTVGPDGNIYLTTGNGTAGTAIDRNNPINRSESLIKLAPDLKVLDFFTPSNYTYLEQNDLDYGVNGIVFMPNTTLTISGSKEGKLFVIDANNLGKLNPADSSVRQLLYANLQNIYNRHIHGTPVYMKTDTSEFVYVWAESDRMRQFQFNRRTGLFNSPVVATRKLDVGMPGANLTTSSDGTKGGTGILWAAYVTSGDANHAIRPGTLAAYDARDVGRVLWTSDNQFARDGLGLFAKFNPPVVANGNVYVATFSNRLDVYGVLTLTATEPAPAEQPFLIFPNPTDREFTLRYTLTQPEPKLSVKIMDTGGRLLQNQLLDGQTGTHETRLSLGNAPAGTFQVVIYANEQVRQVLRLVKQ